MSNNEIAHDLLLANSHLKTFHFEVQGMKCLEICSGRGVIGEKYRHSSTTYYECVEVEGGRVEHRKLKHPKTQVFSLHAAGLNCQVGCGRALYNELIKSKTWIRSVEVCPAQAYTQVVVDISKLPAKVVEVDAYIVEQVKIIVENLGLECWAINQEFGKRLHQQYVEQRRIISKHTRRPMFITLALMSSFTIIWLTSVQMGIKNLGCHGFPTFFVVQVLIGYSYYPAAHNSLRHQDGFGLPWIFGIFFIYAGSIAESAPYLLCYNQDYLSRSTLCSVFDQRTNITEILMAVTRFSAGFVFGWFFSYSHGYISRRTENSMQKNLNYDRPSIAQRVITTDINDPCLLCLDSLQTEEISIDEISVGDILYVSPGARIPTDGRLLHAIKSASSMPSPEAIFIEECNYKGVNSSPQAKLPYEMMYGTYVNLSSPFLMHVTAIGSKTKLSRLAHPSNDMHIMMDYECISIMMPAMMLVLFLMSFGLALAFM